MAEDSLAWSGIAARTGARQDGPLVDRPGLRVARVGGLAQWLLAVHPGSLPEPPVVRLVEALAAWLGTALPDTARTRAGDLARYACWLAPGRWLLVDADGAAPPPGPLAARRADAPAAAGATLLDRADALLVVDLRGDRAWAMMAAACALDLESDSFGERAAARTLFAGTPALLYRHDGGFRVHLDAGLAPWLAAWLAETAALLDDQPTAADRGPAGATRTKRKRPSVRR